MLSYRHAFHAGNHADVLKHVVLLECLRYITIKDKPICFIDSQAGAGCYDLTKGYATQNAEYETGIGRLWKQPSMPEALSDYLELVRDINDTPDLKLYPGSPLIAARTLRDNDRSILFELHSADVEILKRNCREASVHSENGFTGLKAILPPRERRGLVLIDPSYEDKNDYRAVITTLNDALKRFATGMYLVWYPLLHRTEAQALPSKLRALPAERWLDVRLQVTRPPADGMGMYGSGMFVINPPWTLRQKLDSCLEYLTDTLGKPGEACGYLASSDAEDYNCKR